jgi:hypothetical protein
VIRQRIARLHALTESLRLTAERLLGLPRERAVDRRIPFHELRRGTTR